MSADDLAGSGITAKERLERIEKMLVSIDEKLDNKASREELAALEVRLRRMEVEGSKAARDAIHKAESLAVERLRDIEMLESRFQRLHTDMGADLTFLRREHNDLQRRVAYAFGGVAALVTVSDIVIRLVS